jgi:hypothetical protein
MDLATYPLPDGTWRWVSKAWMIDMRSDAGEVQHDGFEYNWRFRKRKWHADVGILSAGGWVRRRKWVRLMMRPAKLKRETHVVEESPVVVENGQPASHDHASWMDTSSSSPAESISSAQSVMSRCSATVDAGIDIRADDVWRGDDVDQDWARCRSAMRRFGRDGRKLELWKKWLRTYIIECDSPAISKYKGKKRQKQWTEDNTPPASEVPSYAGSLMNDTPPPTLEHIAAVVRKYVSNSSPAASHSYKIL